MGKKRNYRDFDGGDCLCDDGACGTREQSVYLETFPELARNVVSNLDIIDGKNEDVQMTEYGVTEDGKLYIKFKYAEIVDGQVAGEYKTGTVYIAEDKERGSFGYAFSYD